MARPTYEVEELAYALERFEKTLPRREVWPTDFVAQLVDQALVAAGIVTDAALTLIKSSPKVGAEAIRSVADQITEAEETLGYHAQKIAEALRRGDKDVYLYSEFRGDFLRLLRVSIIGWKELAFLDDIKPLLSRFSIEVARATNRLRKSIKAISEIGLKLSNVQVPSLPVPPVQPSPPSSAKPRGALLWAVLAGATAAAVGVAIWRNRRVG